MTERALGWWVMASIALHMVGVAAGSLGRPSMDIVRGAAVAISGTRSGRRAFSSRIRP